MLTPLRVALLCGTPFLVLAARHLSTPYSFWLDELSAVLGAGGPWERLATLLSADVHPPLYLLTLRMWIALAGDGEVATRTLSLVFALAAFGVFCAAAAREGRVFTAAATLFFTSSWLFPFYAQETRSYALLLFVGTLATVMDRRRAAARRDGGLAPWLAVLAILSLIHYFGLLWAGVLLLGDLWRVRRQGAAAIAPRVVAGALMLVWPVAHLALGGVGRRTGGNFWIRVDGVGGTLRTVTQALVGPPHSIATAVPSAQVAVVLFWGLSGLALVATSAWLAGPRTRTEIGALAGRVAAVVAIAALVDLHTPISTGRNYIVLLPAMALLFGHVVRTLWAASPGRPRRAAVAVVVVAYIAVSGARAVQAMRDRWAPRQNWKGLVESVEASGTCRPHCRVAAGGQWVGYYARNLTLVPVESTRLIQGAAGDRSPILAFHILGSNLISLRQHFRDWRCLEPRQSRRGMVVLLLPPGSPAPPNLRGCL